MRRDAIRVDNGGVVHLDDSLGRRYGLLPGTEWDLTQTKNGLLLQPRPDDLLKVYVEATNVCNLNCRTCVRNVWDESLGMMSDETFGRVLDSLRALPSVQTVHFGGFGEPMAHPHIFEMLQQVKALGLRTEMITNGTLLDETRCDRLLATDLDFLAISIDGARQPTYDNIRLGSDLDVVLRNLQHLARVRFRADSRKPDLGLSFVAMDSNLEELLELKRLSARLGISRIIVSNVLPHTQDMSVQRLYGTFTATSMPRRPQPNPDDALVELPRLDLTPRNAEVIRRLARNQGNVLLAGTNLNEAPRYCRFVQERNAFVRWDGEVAPCMPLLHSYPCFTLHGEKRIVSHSFGSVNTLSLAEIWNKQAYRDFRRRVRAFDFSPCIDCGSCEMAESNQEDCFGNPAPVCGDCLWAQGIIQCP